MPLLVLNRTIWLVLAGLLVSMTTLSAESADRQIFTERNAHFEIIGEDRRSVRFVNELSEHIASKAMAMLAERDTAYPTRILITLQKSAPEDQPLVRVRVGARGAVRVDFRWSDSVHLELTTQAIAHAYLLRYAHYAGGAARSSQLPQWTVSAVATEAYLSLRPAVLSGMMDELSRWNTPDLQDMLGEVMPSAYSRPVDRAGYWLWTLIKDSATAKLCAQYLRANLLSEVDLLSLKQIYQSNGPEAADVAPDAWWQAGVEAIRSSELNRYETLLSSREWITLLSQVEGLTLPNGTRLENLKDLWVHREEAELRTVLEARRELLVLRLDRVNPAYYNAARSLGSLFETVLRSDRMADFIGALSEFLGDFEDTKRLEQRVQEELQ